MMDTLAIVGVGLLGGSLALAVRERQLARRILGVSRHADTLKTAQARGMIDAGYQEITDDLQDAELTVICTPVNQIPGIAKDLLRRFPQMLVSDVGSTKELIVSEIDKEHLLAPRFIGGHPLAGSEKSGPEHALVSLFTDKLMFLTPGKKTDHATTQRLTAFWQALGSSVIEMDAGRHDSIMAYTSHLPHLAAFALAGVVEEKYLQYSGTGLRSMTRLAGGDTTMWTAIAQDNREHLLESLDSLQHQLDAFRQALISRDTEQLDRLFRAGRKVYHALGS